MPIRPIEVSTLSKIPTFVPIGALYVTLDTNLMYVGTGKASPNVISVGGGGGTPAGSTGALQYNNAGAFGGSTATIDAPGNITAVSLNTSGSNGGITLAEGTGAGLTPGAGVDVVWADSTAHRLKANLNNGGAVSIPTVASAAVSGHFATYAANGIDLVDGGSGGVAAGASLVNVLMQRPKRWTYNVAGSNATIANYGSGAGSALQAGTASIIAGSASNSPVIQWASGVVSGNQAGWAYNGITDFWSGNNLYWCAYIWNKNADLTNQRMWVGLTGINGGNNTTNYNSDTPGNTDKIAMFRFSSVAGDTNWQCVTGDASAQTVTDSGVAADVANPHVFEVRQNDGVNVQFYIDGTLVATNTTHLPMTGGPNRQAPLGLITTQTTAAKNLALGWQSIQSDK